MPELPNQRDTRSTDARSAAKEPLMAAIGAGDLATKALGDALKAARERVSRRAEATRSELSELPAKFESHELRDRLEAARDSARNLYKYLARHGERTVDHLRERPAVRRAVNTAESAVGDARGLADDVLHRVTGRVRGAKSESDEQTGSGATRTKSTAVVDRPTETTVTEVTTKPTPTTSRRQTARTSAARPSSARPTPRK